MKNIHLKEVYMASQPLVATIATRHQDVEDTLRYLRLMFRLQALEAGINNPLAQPLNTAITHLQDMQTVLASYHRAIGEAVKDEEKRQDPKAEEEKEKQHTHAEVHARGG